MEEIMAVLQPVIEVITGLINGGEGAEGFDISSIIEMITGLLSGLI